MESERARLLFSDGIGHMVCCRQTIINLYLWYIKVCLVCCRSEWRYEAVLPRPSTPLISQDIDEDSDIDKDSISPQHAANVISFISNICIYSWVLQHDDLHGHDGERWRWRFIRYAHLESAHVEIETLIGAGCVCRGLATVIRACILELSKVTIIWSMMTFTLSMNSCDWNSTSELVNFAAFTQD